MNTDIATNAILLGAQYAGDGDRAFYTISTPSFLAAILLILILLAIIVFTDLL